MSNPEHARTGPDVRMNVKVSRRDFPLLTEWYLHGELLLDELITRRIALAEVEDAFQAMERGETLRSVIGF